MTGRVFEVREFCLHDGPGPRTTVFLQGCPLRCTWCQNPEGQEMGNVRTGELSKDRTRGDVEASELAAEIRKTSDFLISSGGGVTFSGGEPLCQPDFICEVVDLLADDKLTFAVETSGFAKPETYRKVVRKMDLVLQDVKFPDTDGYRRWTGVNPEMIFDNIAWLKQSGVPFVARIPLMPGVNDSSEMKTDMARRLAGAPNLLRVELLPYNRLAGSKYAKLGRVYAPGFDESRAPDLSTAPLTVFGLRVVSM